MTDIRQAIIDKTNEVLADAQRKFAHYANAPLPNVSFTVTGKQAGTAYGYHKIIYNLIFYGT